MVKWYLMDNGGNEEIQMRVISKPCDMKRSALVTRVSEKLRCEVLDNALIADWVLNLIKGEVPASETPLTTPSKTLHRHLLHHSIRVEEIEIEIYEAKMAFGSNFGLTNDSSICQVFLDSLD